MESNSIITGANLAIHGVGITISSASIIRRMEQTPINLLPLDRKLMDVVFFITSKSGEKSPALENLISIFQKTHLQAKIG